jgi:uncharacterized protein YkwD
VLFCAIASADIIYLNTGGVVKGKIIERDTDSIVIVTEQGNRTEIFLSDIDRIEEGASVDEMYREKAAKIKAGDAEAHYLLGMWLKKVNYHKLAAEEFEKTIILDPGHEFARAELGYVKRKQGWIIPKEESAGPWVHGLKKKGRRPRAVKRKRLKFDRKLIEGLPEDIINAADKLLDPDAKVRSEAYEAFDGATDEQIVALVKILMQAHYDRIITTLESRQKNILRLLKGQTSKTLHDMQVKWFDRWEKARLNALKIIYDREIYPDANHGRSGQPKVDQAVNKVKKIWPYYDALVKAELGRILRVNEKSAAKMLDDYDLKLAQLREIKAWLNKSDIKTEEYEDAVTDVYRALLCHRAKRYTAGMAYARRLEDWEFRLYFRLMSMRILHYNDKIVKTTANVEERKLVQITNNYRMIMGRLPVEIDDRLMKCCKKHSQEMNRLGYFSHTSPTKGLESPGKRAAKEGYNGGVGENIYTGMGSAGAAFSGWYHSSGHHRNMLGGGDPQRMNGKAKGDRSQEGPNFSSGGWRTMGCGRDGNKFTEQFGPLSNLDKSEDKKK